MSYLQRAAGEKIACSLQAAPARAVEAVLPAAARATAAAAARTEECAAAAAVEAAAAVAGEAAGADNDTEELRAAAGALLSALELLAPSAAEKGAALGVWFHYSVVTAQR
jgi:hypothetical protein